MTTRPAAEQMVEEWRIRRLLVGYCRLVDDNRFTEIPALFTDDAVLAFGGQRRVGRVEIEEYFHQVHRHERSEPFGMHLLGNSVIELESDHAIASSDFVQIWRVGQDTGEDAAAVVAGAHAAAIPLSGRYEDRLVVADTAPFGWLITSRTARLLAPSPFVGEQPAT